jgi:hypothetical protein
VLPVEALSRHRGKGQQKVTVEHVHVHAGGQAIVGNVGIPVGGVRSKSEEQPDAKQISHAPQPEMPSPHEIDRKVVPIPCDDERSLQDARREVSGCGQGK